MVTEIKFSFVEDGKEITGILTGTEDYDLEPIADILTGMHAIESDNRYYKTAKRLIENGCKNLMKSI